MPIRFILLRTREWAYPERTSGLRHIPNKELVRLFGESFILLNLAEVHYWKRTWTDTITYPPAQYLPVDSEAFVKAVEERILPIAPIVEFAIKKQLNEVGADRSSLTPDQAMRFIDKMTGALDLFAGPTKALEAKQFMLKALRRTAPGYLEAKE